MIRSALLVLFISLIFCVHLFGAPPGNDHIAGAKILNDLSGYCSEDGFYSTLEATSSGYRKGTFWSSEGKDIWFKFTAIRSDISISATGKTAATNANTLIDPLIAIYTYNGSVLTEMIGSMTTANNLTTAYKGGLIVGSEYYIRISAENNHTGTFKLCINNYDPPNKPGQDCSTASILCSKETFTELSVSGSGTNNNESAGTCMGTESNSAWYKWTAANNGTLTFSITPSSNTDDIDWVLYDLGPNGDCAGLSAANAIRCAVGNGINCTPSYFVTGLNLTSTDLSEQRNCPPGQDGWLKYVDMIEGHTYALLIDNFSSGNNGFTVSFGGTGEFEGPKTQIQLVKNDLCSSLQSFTFSADMNASSDLKWKFGEGANMDEASGAGPFLITYSSMGAKSISLKATNSVGCGVTTYLNLYVTTTPSKPDIMASKTKLCINDILKLNTSTVENAGYYWSGPNGFTSTDQNPEISITGPENAGDYKLTVKIGDCESEPSVINIPPIPKTPTAAFYTDPGLNTKYAVPAPITFINESKDAESYLWDFGDGHSSTVISPTHTYTTPGNYEISLTAFTQNKCFNTLTKGKLVVLKDAMMLIPGGFSPNGDGINDGFQINIAGLKNFKLLIINRWGVKLFETADILASWDGKYKNEDLPPAVYYYIVTAKDQNNKPVKYSGSITLLR